VRSFSCQGELSSLSEGSPGIPDAVIHNTRNGQVTILPIFPPRMRPTGSVPSSGVAIGFAGTDPDDNGTRTDPNIGTDADGAQNKRIGPGRNAVPQNQVAGHQRMPSADCVPSGQAQALPGLCIGRNDGAQSGMEDDQARNNGRPVMDLRTAQPGTE
jgi:hypothetical protein